MRGLVRRIAMPAVVIAVAFSGLASAASAAEPDKPQPGLPLLNCPSQAPDPRINVPGPEITAPCNGPAVVNFASWYNGTQLGLTGSTKAQQWSRVPLTMVAANALFWYRTWPDNVPVGEKTGTEFSYNTRTFFVSPEGSDQPYGLSAPITVKTVAFGAIPTQVTVQVAQPLDSDGLPEPLVANPVDWATKPAPGSRLSKITQIPSTRLSARVNIKVLSIQVDGRDVGLEDSCETGPDGRLDVASDDAEVPVPRNKQTEDLIDPEKSFYGLVGGRLNGSISIPAFSGCKTRLGDDVSPLLTSALSSENNPLSVQIGALACIDFDGGPIPLPTEVPFPLLPLAPGVNDPRDADSSCVAAKTNPAYANNPKIKTIPDQFALPTTPVEPVTNQE